MKRLGASSKRNQQDHPTLRPPPFSKSSSPQAATSNFARRMAVLAAVLCSVLLWYLKHQKQDVVTSNGEVMRVGIKTKEQKISHNIGISYTEAKLTGMDPKPPDEVKATIHEAIGDVTSTTKDKFHDDSVAALPVGLMPSCQGKTDFGKSAVWKAFEAAIALLDKMGVEYWLSAGTLLGFVRECRHIDYDLDFAISLNWLNSPDREMKLVNTILMRDPRFKHGKILKGVDGTTLSEGSEHKFKFEGKVKVDFFHSFRTPNFFRNGYGTEMGLLSCPRPMQQIQKFQWGNVQVPIPMPYEDVLRATYGDDYMIPQKRRKRDENFLWKATHGGCLVLRQGLNHRDANVGIISCLTEDTESVAEAAALVQSLEHWGVNVTIEFYHRGTVSRKDQNSIGRYLDTIHFVELPADELSRSSSQDADLTKMFTEALASSSLDHALLVRPSIIFLRNPLHWVYTAEYIHKLDPSCSGRCSHGHTCATSTDWELGVAIKKALPKHSGICIRSHANITTPKLIYQPSSTEVATIHSSVHGTLNWAYPTANYVKLSSLDWQTDPFVLKTLSGEVQKVPEEYEPYLR